jgi:hypothetical protein
MVHDSDPYIAIKMVMDRGREMAYDKEPHIVIIMV